MVALWTDDDNKDCDIININNIIIIIIIIIINNIIIIIR